MAATEDVTLCAVVQSGRLEAEAVLLVASLRAAGWGAPLILAEPETGPLWPQDSRITPEGRAFLTARGAEIVPLHPRVFGASYPHGNKIEALGLLPAGRPFLFLDSDTLVLDRPAALPAERPSASLRRRPTWPKPRPGGPGRAAIWRALYARFGLDAGAAIDRRFPPGDWQRWPYYNAGWILGPCPQVFGRTFLAIARAIRDDPPPELDGQTLDPWLDQVALPLALHALGGRPDAVPLGALDGTATLHYRMLPLLYAMEPDATVARLEAIAAEPDVRALLSRYAPFRAILYDGQGAMVRALFDRTDPLEEPAVRRRLRTAGLLVR